MRLNRITFVVLVAVVVLATTVPAVQARSFEKPASTVHSQGGSWLDFAMSWLVRITGNEPPAVSRTMKTTTTTTTGTHYQPMTGLCIDPQGNPRCGGV